MKLSSSTLVASALFVSTAQAAPKCHDFKFPVFAKANNNVILDPNMDLTTAAGVESALSSGLGGLGQGTGFLPVQGTYNIAARYCEPQGGKASRAKTVQFLQHGVPYNKDYWNGVDYKRSKPYSWIDYATSQGYPTLAIDNLGAGDSEKPDPITVVQQNLQTEVAHNVIKMLRSGALRKYGVVKADKVIYVGHSLGSVEGNAIATKYPTAVDAFVFTAYTYTLAEGAIGVLGTELTPASVHDPSRFGNLPPGYITFGSKEGKRNTYYGEQKEFSQKLASFDFATEDLFTIGALVTAFSGLQKAPNYKGDVFVLTGQQDALFCSAGSRAIEIPNCGKGDQSIPAQTKSFYPAANFAYYMPPGTSHAATLHYTAMTSIKKAHAFLARSGY